MREKKLVLWSLGFLRLILLRGLFFETAQTRYATKRPDHTIQFTAWVFLSSQSISLTSGMFDIAKISSAIEARFQPFSGIRSSILPRKNSLEKEVRAVHFPISG